MTTALRNAVMAAASNGKSHVGAGEATADA
jgi:hypothetical protein